MSAFDKLLNIHLKNKERYLQLFKDLIKEIKAGTYDFKDKQGDNYLIINENRMNSKFVHIVPKELINLFNEMKEEAPEDFLGFTVLINNTRVSCFGLPCSILSKAIIN